MKAQWFTGYYTKTKDELIGRLSQALRWLIDRKNLNAKTCAIPTAIWRNAISPYDSSVVLEPAHTHRNMAWSEWIRNKENHQS
jgi:hypothetical protein